MECKHKRICEVMAGLGDVEILEASEPLDGALLVEVRTVGGSRRLCPGCGGRVWSKGERLVELVDLPMAGRAVRLGWRKRRLECPDSACGVGSFTEQDPRIAPERGLLTCRAARWAAEMVGRKGRTVSDAAEELGCDWHTVNKEVIRWGQALLEADEDRIGAVEAIGVDETMFLRTAPYRRPRKQWCTSIVDVEAGQLLDIVPGREAAGPARWLQARPKAWREQIRWAVPGPVGPVPGRLQRGHPPCGTGRGSFSCGPAGQQPPRRGPPQGPERDRRPPGPQRRSPLPDPQAVDPSPRTPQPRRRGTPPRPPGGRGPLRRSPAGLARQRNPPRRLPNPRPRPRRRLHPPARRRPPGPVLPPGGQPTRPRHRPLVRPDRGLAPLPGVERTHRSSQQSHPNASNESGSGSATSPTTGSGLCSTQANPTGTYSPR